MNIAFFSTKSYDRDFFNKANEAFAFDLTFFDGDLNEKTANLSQGFSAVCVFVNDDLNEKTIAILAKNNVRYLLIRAAGFNNVDLSTCKKHHIEVARVPAYSPHGVAEHAFALLLSLNRKIHKAYYRLKENNFALEGLLGFSLYQKKMGIIGLGNIGKAAALIAKGFGMDVFAAEPNPDKDFMRLNDINLCDLETIYQTCDIISLHCPLNESSHHLIDEKAISMMKTSVILLNTGRGALIDSKALIQGLKQNRFLGVGLDVYEQEHDIFFEDHSQDIIKDDDLMRLMTFPNVLITAHQGFFTKEALSEIANTTLNNLKSLINGTCENKLN